MGGGGSSATAAAPGGEGIHAGTPLGGLLGGQLSAGLLNDRGPGSPPPHSPPPRQLSAGLLNDRGVCLLALGHPRGALEAFTDCLAIEPGHAAARANLATARGRLGGSDHQGGPSID